jgi:hypothetical protein
VEISGEVGVAEFVRLMEDYLSGRIGVIDYTKSYFAMSKKRVNIPDETADEIIQRGYGDADDYDPVVRLPNTILEPELRERVAKSLRALSSRGYGRENKR